MTTIAARLRRSLLPLASACLTLSASAASPALAAGAPGPLDPRLARLAVSHPAAPVEAIATFRGGVSAHHALADVRRAGGRVVARVQLIDALAVRLTAAEARVLAGERDLTAVALNAPVRAAGSASPALTDSLADTFDATLDAPALWSSGGTGAGVGVAVLDTGVQGDLPDFATADGSSRVVASAATNPGATTADDTYGHGTAVAGIIAGDSTFRAAGDPLRGQFRGVAPQAGLISVKVADEQGGATVLDVIYGLQFAVDFARQLKIRVVNLSLDEDTPQSYREDPLDAAVEAAWTRGLVVVVAAGNRGNVADAVNYAPANDPYVITVGAADEQATPDPSDDLVASWSSRGTTQDGFAKPDLYAPGAHIASVLSPSSWFASQCQACIVDGQYFRASGTSFAAPMVSGLVADLLQVHPEWTPDQVKGALLESSVRTNGLPEVDALKVAGVSHPVPADRGLQPNTLLAGADGALDLTRSSWSRSSWSSADWTRSSWSRSSWSRSSWSIASTSPSRSSWSTTSWDWQGS